VVVHSSPVTLQPLAAGADPMAAIGAKVSDYIATTSKGSALNALKVYLVALPALIHLHLAHCALTLAA
jgi:hypothetical protein